MGRPSFRDKIVASGMQTVHERGFASTGLREITAAAGVAQGSFTNHFASKEAFGIAILDRYFDAMRTVIAGTLEDPEQEPLVRLQAYFDTVTALFAASNWRFGCLAGNMALEAAEHSEAIRHKLEAIFAEWTPPFAKVIRQAQASGDVAPDLDANEAGAALLEAWHGAMLRMKIERSSAPLDRFKRLILPAVLRQPPHQDGRAGGAS